MSRAEIQKTKMPLAGNLGILYFYRAKARQREPGGLELGRRKGKDGEEEAPARQREPGGLELGRRKEKESGEEYMEKVFEYDEIIHEIPEKGGAYVIFPWNIKEVFGRGRVKVHAEFDGIPYDGSIVNMGVKDADGNVCYIIGVLKAIRTKLGKKDGDSIHVVVKERE